MGKEFVVFQWLASLVIAGLVVWLIVEIIKGRKEKQRMDNKLHDFKWAREEMMHGHHMKCEGDTIYFIKYGDLWSRSGDAMGKLANIGVKELFSTKWEYADEDIKEESKAITGSTYIHGKSVEWRFDNGELLIPREDGTSKTIMINELMAFSEQGQKSYCTAYVAGYVAGVIQGESEVLESLTSYIESRTKGE